MRKIHWIVVHCSDSDIASHDNIETVRNWHTLPKMPKEIADKIRKKELPKTEAFKYGNGWNDIGYHYFISKDGSIHLGRPEDKIGSHVAGHNSGSLGVCLSGRKAFTAQQFTALEKLLKDICKRHELTKQDILAHHDLDANKTCPNFDVHEVVSKWSWF